MAVTQISKITVRRGKRANLPQLSYGEIGWAVDTRQLFIGNGSLTDGASVEGNTEILTELSELVGIQNSVTSVVLTDNTFVATSFYTFSISYHPAGMIKYSIDRNGVYQAGTIQYAFDGTSTLNITHTGTPSTTAVGVTITVAIVGTTATFSYISTNTGNDAIIKIKREDYF